MTRLAIAGIVTFFLLSTLIGCASPPGSGSDAAKRQPLVVYLVRHTEKVDGGADPELSAAGRERAATLAATLRSAQIERIHSSDYIRTRNTAAPVAAAFELDVELYDPADLPGMADRLREMGGRHLVVGHSNTTPVLAGLLGGDPGTEIDEASEYDRLYVVTAGVDGTVSTTLMRYGTPYHSPCDPVDPVLANSSFVIVTQPAAGATVSSPIDVRGCSRTFESNIVWQLQARDGRTLASGHSSGGGVDGAASYSFTATFTVAEPQLGHLEVFEVDASGGEGFPAGRAVIPLILLPESR